MSLKIRSIVSRSLIVIAFLTALYRAADVPAAQAATRIVSDCSAPSGAAGRLVDVIAAASAGDTITFSCSGTITLSSTITIDKNLIIDGSGQSVTISGGDVAGVFVVNSGQSVTLNYLTITHGKSTMGGGIANWGILTVTGSTFTGNSATQEGGGIYNAAGATLTLANSTVWGNSVINLFGIGYGGGVSNYGNLTVVNSTLSGNYATLFGAGLMQQAGGSMSLANTIIANSTGAWDCFSQGTLISAVNNLIVNNLAVVCGSALTADPLLGGLTNNGGSTATMALGVGSPAIDTGDDTTCAAALIGGRDQRGAARSAGAHCDIGAYEYLGGILVTNNHDSGPGSLRQAIADAWSGARIIFDAGLSGTTIALSSQLVIDKNVTIDGSALTTSITVSGQNAVRVFDVNTAVSATLNSLTIANGNAGGSGGGIYNAGTLTVQNSTLKSNTAGEGGGIYNNGGGLTVVNSTLSGNSATFSGGGIYNYSGVLRLTNSTLSANTTTNALGGGLYNYGTLIYANTIVANSPHGGDCQHDGGTIASTNNLVENGACSATWSGDPHLGPLQNNGGATETFALQIDSFAIDRGDDAICAAAPVSGKDQSGGTRPKGAHCDIGAYEYWPKEITAFNFTSPAAVGIINGNNIAVSVPYGTVVTALVPTIVHTGASVSPASGAAHDFTSPVIYTVTAGDGSTRTYTVTVTVLPCSAAITVANANDSGAGSLRQAIVDICPGSTITFGGDYSIALLSTLTIGRNMTLDGAGRTVTVDGQNAVRVFAVNSGVTAVLNNLTIANGNDGGSTGGGINNHGTLTVKNSTFVANSSYAGGSIYNNANLTVANSTFSANSASWGGDGGGIYNESGGTLTLMNSTFSGNHADWGGGSIFNVGTLKYANTILADSTIGGGGLECFNSGGTIGTNTNNLVEGGGCSAAFIGDPQLGPLQNNGGGTQTFALPIGSPAIDAGDDATCAAAPVSGKDQRGLTRLQGAGCDIGAYEYFPKAITAFSFASPAAVGTINGNNIAVSVSYATDVTTLVPTIVHTGASVSPASGAAHDFTNPVIYTVTAGDGSTRTYTVTVTVLPCSVAITIANANDSGAGSLRQAMADICPGGTITFGGDYSIALLSTLTIGRNMTLDGAGHAVTVSGQNAVRVFTVNSGVTATLNSLTIANGNAGGNGGGIYNTGTLTVQNSTLKSNTAGEGGGIYNNEGGLTVVNSTLSGNSATFSGGGIYNYSGVLRLTNSTLSANTTTNALGGGLYNYGTLIYANTIVANSPHGGDCQHDGGTIASTNNLVENGACSATWSGDPHLGPLQNNGGATETFALQIDSFAIDRGDDAICAAAPVSGKDQSGGTRPKGAHCDIGAYEYWPKEITAFSFASPAAVGIINGNNIAVSVPYGAVVTALVPTIVHTGASVSPASGAAHDFTSPVIYTVTAGDGSTRTYTVIVVICGSGIVSNANDSGSGSLRQIIADACPGGTITFNGDYTIALASTLTIDKNLTLDGAERAITVSGQNAVRVFIVDSGVSATLNSLTIANGNARGGASGGGIYNAGALTVQNSTFSGNRADWGGGGMYNNGGSLTVVNSTLSGNIAGWYGGGISNYGTLRVMNSTLLANRATMAFGGGIYNYGTLIYANTIIANSPSGGDCRHDSGTVTSTNNLVEDGSCSAVFSGNPQLGPLQNNGGATGTFALLAGSPAIDAGDDATCAAAPVSGRDQRGFTRPGGAHCDIGAYEYFPKAITAFSFASPPSVGMIDGTYITFVFPQGTDVTALVPTITYTGVSVSPASGVAQDFTNRVIYTVFAADNFSKAYTVTMLWCNSAAVTVTNTNDSGAGSLRQAMADICPGGTIIFDGDYTIALSSTLTIDRNVTIDGTGHTVTVSGQNTVSVFTVRGGVTAMLNGLTIANGNASGSGGGIYNAGTLTVQNSILKSNTAGEGGGIYNYQGSLTVANSTLSGNSAVWSGGGIYNYSGVLRLTNSTLSANTTTSALGGGIYNYGTLIYANTIVANSPHGGDCRQEGGTVTSTNNLVEDGSCSATWSGDPHLGPLQNNGGATETFALQADSVAIDRGDPATCASASIGGLDQRGQTRDDLQCDIGAFELKYADSPTVTKAVSGAGTYTFGPTMVKIVVNNTGSCLTGITIQRYNANHPNATTAIQTGHWWDITPVGCTSGFNVDLTLPTDFTPNLNDKVCRYASDTTWDCAMTSSTLSSITRNSVTGFSQWAVGNNVKPTAIVLFTFRADSSDGFPPLAALAVIAMLAIGLGGLIGGRRARSTSLGLSKPIG